MRGGPLRTSHLKVFRLILNEQMMAQRVTQSPFKPTGR